MPERYQALVCAAAGAGLRWGECAGLRWGDVDLERGRLSVVQVAVETPASVTLRPFPKSQAGQRTVPMPAFLVDALTRLRAGMLGQVEETQEGFRASWRGSDNTVRHATFATRREAVAQVAKLATGGLRFHDMRHSYATWLVSQGLPVNIVRKVMGHEQASTTLDIYTHAPDDYEQRVTAALDGPVAFLLPYCACRRSRR